MKTKLLLTTFFGFLFAFLQANTWVINNNDANADFTEILDAHNSNVVVDGDTLYVEGSKDAYSSFDCSKRLVIIGAGYYLNTNRPTANVWFSKIYSIDFVSGSEGSVVMGMTFTGGSVASPEVYVNNISIIRCYSQGNVDLSSVSGIRIVSSDIYGVRQTGSTVTFSDVVLSNNIIRASISTDSDCEFQKIENNILLGSSFTMSVAYFRNNILMNGSAALNINGTYVTNNIATNYLFATDNYNVADLAAMFVGGDSPDAKYVLSESSFAIGKAHDGSDCGIFGGEAPYVISGLPTIPVITELETSQSGSTDSGLKVRVKIATH